MSRYGINCQHFLVGWSCDQHEPMSPGGIFSSTDLLNIKHPHTNTFTYAYTNFAQLVHAKKNKKHSTEFTIRIKRLLAPLVQLLQSLTGTGTALLQQQAVVGVRASLHGRCAIASQITSQVCQVAHSCWCKWRINI